MDNVYITLLFVYVGGVYGRNEPLHDNKINK